MVSKNPLRACTIFDLAGREYRVPHKFVYGCCARCGELEPKEIKVAQKKYSGKSNSVNKWNEYQ